MMASPHRAATPTISLFETMLIEYALGAAWHDRSIREKIVQMRESYLLLMQCGTLIAKGW